MTEQHMKSIESVVAFAGRKKNTNTNKNKNDVKYLALNSANPVLPTQRSTAQNRNYLRTNVTNERKHLVNCVYPVRVLFYIQPYMCM